MTQAPNTVATLTALLRQSAAFDSALRAASLLREKS